MFIYICCAGGATSSMLCENIKKAAGDLIIHFDHITAVISDIKLGKLKDFDIILGYGAASSLTDSFVTEYTLDKFLDLVLISPQVRFELGRVQKVMNPYNIPSASIDMRSFGTMDGKKMISEILSYENRSYYEG